MVNTVIIIMQMVTNQIRILYSNAFSKKRITTFVSRKTPRRQTLQKEKPTVSHFGSLTPLGKMNHLN